MSAPLPVFRCHPDPVATGSIIQSGQACDVCGLERGWTYKGPVYGGRRGPAPHICPWCIADGSAHARLGVEFANPAGVGDDGTWDSVSDDIRNELSYRTPCFSGWQQERWLTHCHDAAAFLGPAGAAELQAFGPEAYDAIAKESGFQNQELAGYMKRLHKSKGPTAYVFRCLHCGVYGGYSDIY